MDTAISITGTVASILGAIVSVIAWRGAVSAYSRAKAVRDDLIHHRSLGEISALQKMTQQILRVTSRIGISSTAESTRGLVASEVAREIDEFRSLLKEHSDFFNIENENHAVILCNKLGKPIEELSEAVEFEQIKSAGKKIQSLIGDFQPVIKKRVEQFQSENVLK